MAKFDISMFLQAPEVSEQTSIFGGVFFASKSILGVEGQKKLFESFGAMLEY